MHERGLRGPFRVSIHKDSRGLFEQGRRPPTLPGMRSETRALTKIDRLAREGAERMLVRASDARGTDADSLARRLSATLEKYLFRHQPDASQQEAGNFIDSLNADELLLVMACERGDEHAWHDLIEGYRATVLSAARSACSGEAEAEELADSVWAELYGLRERANGGRAGKLAYYSGCGSLGGWLRAVVGQMRIDVHRRTSRLVQTEEASEFDRAIDDKREGDAWRAVPPPNPENELADIEASEAVMDALGRAVSELDDEDRLLVKLYYLDGLKLKQAGAVLGFHEATASRRLNRIHKDIRVRVKSILIDEARWTVEETNQALAEIAASGGDTRDVQALLTKGARANDEREKFSE